MEVGVDGGQGDGLPLTLACPVVSATSGKTRCLQLFVWQAEGDHLGLEVPSHEGAATLRPATQSAGTTSKVLFCLYNNIIGKSQRCCWLAGP